MVVLLIGYRDDPHLLAVAETLTRYGGTSFILDPHSLNDRVTLELGGGSSPVARVNCGERGTDVRVRSIWFRLKPIVELPHWGPMQTSAAQFAQGEWRTTLRALEHLLPQARWVNRPHAQQIANSKITQLILARDCGFSVPDTLVTNDPDAVVTFLRKHGRVIYKTLEWAAFPDQTGVYTTEINESLVREHERSIKRAPGIFQRFIEKQFELRVTVVGEEFFVARINTPQQGRGAIDWRHAIFSSIYEEGAVDLSIKASILEYQRRLGLAFGAYDLACSPSGEVFFLECNPAGQYLWIENAVSLPITDAVARLLLYDQHT